MVTQQAVAKRCGLDVSTCNKILNAVPGPVFRKETIRLVFKVAREMGYRFRSDTKPLLKRRVEKLEAALREVVPQNALDQSKLSEARVQEIRELLYGKKSA